MSSSEPSKWTMALGASADVNVIPATTPAGTGLASMSSLFPAITQVPIDAGGIAPERADFNALFKLLGDSVYFLQQGGVFSYLNSYPYTAGNLVTYSGAVYECVAANGPGNVHAPTDTAYWRRLATLQDIPPAATVNDGQLTINVNGAQVATFTANQAGNTTANITISEIHSQGGSGDFGWVRFKSGLQIVFSSGTADEVLNFPVAFIDNPRLLMTSPTTGGTYVGVPGWYERTTTYFKGNVYDPVDHQFIADGHFDYIAIGFWK